jgi:predicted DNA-binding transcriptional regulator AlpA
MRIAMTNDTYLSLPDLLRRYDITRPTLKRWIDGGHFPPHGVKIRNRRRWLLSAVEDFERRRAAQ